MCAVVCVCVCVRASAQALFCSIFAIVCKKTYAESKEVVYEYRVKNAEGYCIDSLKW